MSDKDKIKELEIRMSGLIVALESVHDLAMKMATFDKDWINELKKHLK